MNKFEPSAAQRRDVPPHIADAGKIVLGAGVRLPVLKTPASGATTVARGSHPAPVATPNNA